MKVTHLNTYTKGGAALAALRIHLAIRNHGIDSKFLTLYKDGCKIDDVIDFREELNSFEKLSLKIKNKILQLKNHRKFSNAGELFCELKSVWPINEHSQVKESEFLHLHWIDGYIDLKKLFGIKNRKFIWTVHDHFPFSGGFHYPPELQNENWNSVINSQKNILKKLFTENHIHFVVPSEHLKELALSSGLIENCRINVVKNTVDESVFTPMDRSKCRIKYSIPEEDIVLFFLSDHINYKRKGFHLLHQVLENTSKSLTLLVAGKGSLTITNPKVKVIHIGAVYDENKLAGLYNCANLLVNPSLNDISSNTIIEAMSCGIPVVAFRSGGIPELIDQTNGILAEQKNMEELEKAIDKALENKFNSEAIRNKALNDHSRKVIAEKYMKIYLSEI